MHKNSLYYEKNSGEDMKDPENHSIDNILEDLNCVWEEEQDEQLTELELEELMEALDTPGL